MKAKWRNKRRWRYRNERGRKWRWKRQNKAIHTHTHTHEVATKGSGREGKMEQTRDVGTQNWKKKIQVQKEERKKSQDIHTQG